MALPQPMSNRDTKVTRGKEPGLTSNRRPPPYKMKVEAPPAYMVKQGRQDALATIRRTITLPRIPAFSDGNPLGLPWDADGQPVKLRLVAIQGDGSQERHIRCNAFCTYLANQSELVQAFNSLSHPQQVFALLLHEPREDEPHSVKDWFLRATGPQRHAVWQETIGGDGALERVQRESKLRHMEVFFQERRQYGHQSG